MRWARALLLRLLACFQRERWEEELEAELESNLAMHVEDGVRAGMSPAEARRQAVLKFGTVEGAKEQYRDRKHLPMAETVLQDFGYGLRTLARSPGFTAVAVVTLALGIGATTAVFTFLDQYLLHPYIYKDQDRLVRVDGYDKKNGRRTGVLMPPDYLDIERYQRVFDTMGAFRVRTRLTPSAEGPQDIPVSELSGHLLPTLGVQPILGRWFSPEEFRRGNENVALLNYGYWRDRFGFEENVVGQEIQLDDHRYEIIGVMPAGFFNRPRVYLPLVFTNEELGEQARSGRLGSVQSWAKLKPGVSLEQAQLNMSVIAEGLAERFPNSNKDRGVEIYRPMDRDRELFAEQAAYYVLPGFFVILIVCANVAHLQLTRAIDRQKEAAVRAAIGAGRWRLVRQFLIESVILAGFGGGLGILIAYVGLDAILAIDPDRSQSRLEFISVDRNALWFAVGLSCTTGILSGIVPALIGSTGKLNHLLKEGTTRSSMAAGGKRLREAMIISQIALTTILLVGAGLMIRNLWETARIEVGYDTSVVTALTKVSSAQSRGPTAGFESIQEMKSESILFMERMLDRLRAIPGVRSAAGAHQISLVGAFEPTMLVQSVAGENTDDQRTVAYRVVTDDFFQTLSIPLLQGRIFDVQDRVNSAPVAVISESLARQLFSGRSPLGQRIVRVRGPRDTEPPQPWQVIGVVADIRWSPLPNDPDPPELYLSFAQRPLAFVALAIRAKGEPKEILAPLRAELLASNPSNPVGPTTTLAEQRANKIRGEAILPAVVIAFASIAVLLSAVGIYGLASYSVSRGTRELGIRMALGARRGQIISGVIRQGLRLSGFGIVIGAIGSWALVQFLRSELTDVQLRKASLASSVDLIPCLMVILFLNLVSITANYLPARRAARVNPITALRCE